MIITEDTVSGGVSSSDTKTDATNKTTAPTTQKSSATDGFAAETESVGTQKSSEAAAPENAPKTAAPFGVIPSEWVDITNDTYLSGAHARLQEIAKLLAYLESVKPGIAARCKTSEEVRSDAVFAEVLSAVRQWSGIVIKAAPPEDFAPENAAIHIKLKNMAMDAGRLADLMPEILLAS